MGRDRPHDTKQASALAWPGLKSLCLIGGAVDRMGVTELTKTAWPCLEYLHLDNLSAGQSAELFTACRWPVLSCLQLSNFELGAVVCTKLSQAYMPVLKELVISHGQFSPAGVTQLTHAHWPNLSQLELSFCKLDTDAVSEVVKGCWPLLRSLVLTEAPATNKRLSPSSVKRLLHGVWPRLDHLVLSPFDCQAAAYLLSGSREVVKAATKDRWMTVMVLINGHA